MFSCPVVLGLLMARVTTSMPFPMTSSSSGMPCGMPSGMGMAVGLPPTPDAARRRRRWFAGIKSLSTVGHHRARGESPGPGSRSISLPESRICSCCSCWCCFISVIGAPLAASRCILLRKFISRHFVFMNVIFE